MLTFYICFYENFVNSLMCLIVYTVFDLDYGKAVLKAGQALGVSEKRNFCWLTFLNNLLQLFLLFHCSFKIILKFLSSQYHKHLIFSSMKNIYY